MEDIDLLTVITILIALWGAVLSTILAFKDFHRDRRSLKVSYGLAITSDLGGNSITLICVEAVNTGHRPITITGGGLLIDDGRTFVQPYNRAIPTKFPARLEDGESLHLYIDLDRAQLTGLDLARKGAKFTGAFVKDAEGRKHIVKLSKGEASYLARMPQNS